MNPIHTKFSIRNQHRLIESLCYSYTHSLVLLSLPDLRVGVRLPDCAVTFLSAQYYGLCYFCRTKMCSFDPLIYSRHHNDSNSNRPNKANYLNCLHHRTAGSILGQMPAVCTMLVFLTSVAISFAVLSNICLLFLCNDDCQPAALRFLEVFQVSKFRIQI